MLSDPSGPETRVLSSVLSMLSLEHCTDLTVQNLTVLTELLCKAIPGAKPVKSKVKDFLERLSSRGAAALTEEQIAEVHAAMATHRDEREAEVGAAMVDTAATPPTTRRGTRKSKRSTSSAASVPQFDLDANGSDEEGETENNGEDPDNIEAVSEDEQEYEVEALLDSRKSGRYNEYLVKWKGYSDEHNTWERTKDISPKLIKVCAIFPAFCDHSLKRACLPSDRISKPKWQHKRSRPRVSRRKRRISLRKLWLTIRSQTRRRKRKSRSVLPGRNMKRQKTP